MNASADVSADRGSDAFFESAQWYDVSINWAARLERELPVLRTVFGEPKGQRLLDAGCGPGRHVVAMSRLGYRVCGLDASPQMLALARDYARREGVTATWIEGRYAELERNTGPFDGVYCLGNALAAAGDEASVRSSINALAGSLSPGGRMFIQVLNFEKLRRESPAVRGPRVTRVDGTLYLSTRVYALYDDRVDVTNVTLYEQEGGWRQFARCGSLYPLSREQLGAWLADAGLRIDRTRGGYDQPTFDPEHSNDLIVAASRKET